MRFESELRDALYVNWAFPVAALPTPDAPLVLDTLRRADGDFGFVTLVLFRQTGLHRQGLAWPALGFPQCNLRLLVRDAERVPSILFVRQLVPAWVVPIARLVARQPASAAVFEKTGNAPDAGEVHWRFAAGTRLELVARPGAGKPEPLVPGGWEENVAFFRERSRGYVRTVSGWRRLAAEHPSSEAIPMRVELRISDWLRLRLPGVPPEAWSNVHSAFLVPSIRLAVAVEAGASEEPREARLATAASGRAAI